jgi:hypothetical protein
MAKVAPNSLFSATFNVITKDCKSDLSFLFFVYEQQISRNGEEYKITRGHPMNIHFGAESTAFTRIVFEHIENGISVW